MKKATDFTLVWGDHSVVKTCADEAHAISLAAAECKIGELFAVETPRGKIKFFMKSALGATPITAARAALENWMASV